MKASTIRVVDSWLGIPACAVLTLWRRLFDWRRTPGPVRRILFFKLVEQGATVLAYPSLRAAVERVGPENVFFMVLEENRAILDLLEIVPPENVIAVPTGGLFTTLAGLVRGLLRVRREKIDSVLDFEFFARSSAVFAYLSGASRRVGYHRFQGGGPWRGDLMTHRLVYSPHVHSLRAMRVMLEALWRDPGALPALDIDQFAFDESLLRFVPTAVEVDTVRATIAQMTGGIQPRRLVLLNANTSDRDLVPLRRWDAERYVELARRLLAENDDVFVAFTGAPSEAGDVEPLVREVNHPRCFSMAGKTTMRQLLVLYTFAEVLVSNDSGPAHFAALTEIEIVTLFGPEVPRLWGVLGPRSHIIWLALPCSPCLSAYNNRLAVECRNNLCMKGITVDRVYETVRGILDRRKTVVSPS
jgi:ADP-heptose:LPS heptosyltransferase